MQMAFQLGRTTLLEFEDLRQEIWDGDWEGAHDEMVDSLWHGQTSERCDRMADAMQDNNPANFLQADDPYDEDQ